MTLTLEIHGHAGGDPAATTRIEVPQTGLAAGRSPSMGWVLPDADRHVSGHHFDIFRQAGGWWLRDVSTNGTFLQGQRFRLDGPHRLADGDRFQVGPYLIGALIEGEAAPDPRPMTAESLPDRSQMADTAAQPAWSAPRRPGLDGFETPPRPVSRPFGFDDLPHMPRHEVTGIKPPAEQLLSADFVANFCNGAGLPPDLYTHVSGPELAQALGQTIRQVSEQVMRALQDRAVAKQLARTGEGTMQAERDNNPLKFLPDADQAIEAMFLRARPGFMTGPQGLADALSDLRLHQSAIFAALQPALARLLADLDPDDIAAEAETGRMGGSRAAKAWEIHTARWQAKAEPHDNGMLDEFLNHFAAAYREAIERGPAPDLPPAGK